MPKNVERRLIASDWHLGLWEKRRLVHSQLREKAIQAMVQQARELCADIHLLGDTVDLDRSSDRDIRRDACAAKGVLTGSKAMIHLGNHDDRLTVSDMQELVGTHTLHRHEVLIDKKADLTLTHGHIFDSSRVRRRIDHLTCMKNPVQDQQRILDYVCDKKLLPREMHNEKTKYEMIEALEARVPALTPLGERIHNMAHDARLWVQWLLSPRRRKPYEQKRNETQGMVDAYITPIEYSAVQLGSVLDTGMVVMGHKHTPFVGHRHVWQKGINSKRQEVLMGNSGSLVQTGQPLTWIITETDRGRKLQTMSLYCYDADRDAPALMTRDMMLMPGAGPPSVNGKRIFLASA